jgi:hypothetical protein
MSKWPEPSGTIFKTRRSTSTFTGVDKEFLAYPKGRDANGKTCSRLLSNPVIGFARNPLAMLTMGANSSPVSAFMIGPGFAFLAAYTDVQDVVRCTSSLGDTQYYGADVRGSETCRGNYPAAPDGHRDPHRACVARSSRFIGPCVCLTRLTVEKERRNARIGRHDSVLKKRVRDKKGRGSIEEPLLVFALTCSHHLPGSAAFGKNAV